MSSSTPPVFTGALTALVTPFRDGVLDEDALARLVAQQLAGGIDGLVACGTTGESATLEPEEIARVVARTVELAGGRVPVVAGAGTNSTQRTIALARAAREAGADGLLLVTPYYNRPSQEGLYRHFSSVCEAVPLPAILYNVPSRTGCDLLPETVARLSEHAPVVGLKEATGSMRRAAELLERCGDAIALLSGDDFTVLPFLALGGRGTISVVSNVWPQAVAGLCRAAREGDWAEARRLQLAILPLARALFAQANPMPVKTAVALLGLASDELRPPLCAVPEEVRAQVRAALGGAGLLT